MNHIYRIIFNRSLGIYQCVCEFAKACGKSSGKIFKVSVLAGAMASGSAFALDINEDEHYTTSSDRAEPINIATTKGSHVTVTVSGKDVVRSMSAKGAYDSNNPHEGRQWIGVGQYGTGILNIENGATVRSADSILLGVMGDKVNRVAHGHGTVNLSGESKLQADLYLIVGDGGNGTLNVNSGSKVNARDIWISSTNHGAGSTINIDGAGQRKDHTSQVNAFTITIGDEGDGTVNVKNDGMISANRLIIGEKATGNLNVSSGGNVAVNNIERGTAGKANLVLNGADIKVEQGNQDDFFKGFTTNDKIELKSDGIEFNVNQYNVTINPNARLTGDVGKFTLRPSPINYSGSFMKVGGGTLTMSTQSKQFDGDFNVIQGKLELLGDYTMKAGETLGIGIGSDSRNDTHADYGQFHVAGNLNIEQGNLTVYAANIVKKLITSQNPNAQWDEIVKANTLTGKFTNFQVLDHEGNPITSNLDTEYKNNAVNLVVKDNIPAPKPIGVVTVGTTTKAHTGDFIMQKGDEIRIRLENQNTYGRLNISGQANFTDGHLSVQASDLVHTLVKTQSADWKNVITTNGRLGEFDRFDVVDGQGQSIESPITPVYDGNNVHLTAKASGNTGGNAGGNNTNTNDGVFAHAVQNTHKTAGLGVASVLDKAVTSPNSSLGKTLVALQTVAKLDDEQLSQITENLEPAINAQAPTVINEQHNLATTAVTDRIFTTRADITQGSDAGGRSLFKRSDNLSNSVWLQAVGQKHKADERDGFAGFDGNSHGFVVGTDGMASDDLRLGVALGHSNSDIDSAGTSVRQNLQTKLTQAYVYGDYGLDDDTSINGFVGYGRANIETERDINVANILTGKAKADYDAKITQLGIGVDHRIGTINDHISPFAQLRYTRLTSDGYKESVSGTDSINNFGVSVSKESENIVRATAGVHFAKPINHNTQLIGSVAGHLENDHRPTISASFNGLSDVSFNQTAQKNDKFSGSLGLGVRHQLSANTEILGQYQGEFSKNTSTNGGTVAIKWKF